MKYFLDTEFIEDGRTIDLISIGIAAEDGRTYYAISYEFDPSKAGDWVRENVLRKLPCRLEVPGTKPPAAGPEWKSRREIRDDIRAFIGDVAPEFWGYFADYDWVVFCWLFGRMEDLPEGFPMYCRDIKQVMESLGLEELPLPKEGEHNALADAIWNKQAFDWLIAKVQGLV
jgi:hypothetical protein